MVINTLKKVGLALAGVGILAYSALAPFAQAQQPQTSVAAAYHASSPLAAPNYANSPLAAPSYAVSPVATPHQGSPANDVKTQPAKPDLEARLKDPQASSSVSSTVNSGIMPVFVNAVRLPIPTGGNNPRYYDSESVTGVYTGTRIVRIDPAVWKGTREEYSQLMAKGRSASPGPASNYGILTGNDMQVVNAPVQGLVWPGMFRFTKSSPNPNIVYSGVCTHNPWTLNTPPWPQASSIAGPIPSHCLYGEGGLFGTWLPDLSVSWNDTHTELFMTGSLRPFNNGHTYGDLLWMTGSETASSYSWLGPVQEHGPVDSVSEYGTIIAAGYPHKWNPDFQPSQYMLFGDASMGSEILIVQFVGENQQMGPTWFQALLPYGYYYPYNTDDMQGISGGPFLERDSQGNYRQMGIITSGVEKFFLNTPTGPGWWSIGFGGFMNPETTLGNKLSDIPIPQIQWWYSHIPLLKGN